MGQCFSVFLCPTVEIHFPAFVTKSPHMPCCGHVAMEGTHAGDPGDKDTLCYGHASVLLSVNQCVTYCFSKASAGTGRAALWAAKPWWGTAAGGDREAGCPATIRGCTVWLPCREQNSPGLCFCLPLLFPLPPPVSFLSPSPSCSQVVYASHRFILVSRVLIAG